MSTELQHTVFYATYAKCGESLVLSVICCHFVWTQLRMRAITLNAISTRSAYRTDADSLAQLNVAHLISNSGYLANEFMTRYQGIVCAFPALHTWLISVNHHMARYAVLLDLRLSIDAHLNRSYRVTKMLNVHGRKGSNRSKTYMPHAATWISTSSASKGLGSNW